MSQPFRYLDGNLYPPCCQERGMPRCPVSSQVDRTSEEGTGVLLGWLRPDHSYGRIRTIKSRHALGTCVFQHRGGIMLFLPDRLVIRALHLSPCHTRGDGGHWTRVLLKGQRLERLQPGGLLVAQGPSTAWRSQPQLAQNSRLSGGPKVLTVSPHSEPRARRPTTHHPGEAGKVESNAREIHWATCWSHEVGPKWSLCPPTASQVLFCLKPNCGGQALGLPA